MNGIAKVLDRINAIEQRFGRKMDNGNFAGVLNDAISVSEAEVPNGGPSEISGMLSQAAGKYGVDHKLVRAIATAESGLSQAALSPVGAVGVMQLMPETARELGVKNINDARQNIDGGVRYLKNLLTDYHGDIQKAVAAYNAGPGAVNRYQGVPPYEETRQYVAKVLDLYKQ